MFGTYYTGWFWLREGQSVLNQRTQNCWSKWSVSFSRPSPACSFQRRWCFVSRIFPKLHATFTNSIRCWRTTTFRLVRLENSPSSASFRHLYWYDICPSVYIDELDLFHETFQLGPSWYAHEKFSKGSSILYALDASLYAYNQLRLRTAYVFLYVSYYSIGHRINCLRHILKDTIDLKDSNTPSNPITCDRHPKYFLAHSSLRVKLTWRYFHPIIFQKSFDWCGIG